MPKLGQQLSRRRCRRCRESKIKVTIIPVHAFDPFKDLQCTPIDRIWPTDKCEQCIKAGLPCSANLTASEAREEDLGTSAAEMTRPSVQADCLPALSSKRYLVAHQSCTHSGGPLLSAVLEGHTATVRLLLEARADVGEQSDIYGHSLEIAAAQGHLEIVQILLKFGADANQAGVNHINAVQASSVHGHTGVVRYLLEHGAKLSSTSQDVGPLCSTLEAPSTQVTENATEQQPYMTKPATDVIAPVNGPPQASENLMVSGSDGDQGTSGRETGPQRTVGGEEDTAQDLHPLPSDQTSVLAVDAHDLVEPQSKFHSQHAKDLCRSLHNPFELDLYGQFKTNFALDEEYGDLWSGDSCLLPPLPDSCPLSVHDTLLEQPHSPPPASDVPELRSTHNTDTVASMLPSATSISGRSSPATTGPTTPRSLYSRSVLPSPQPTTTPWRHPGLNQDEGPLLPSLPSSMGFYRCDYPGCTAAPFQNLYLLK